MVVCVCLRIQCQNTPAIQSDSYTKRMAENTTRLWATFLQLSWVLGSELERDIKKGTTIKTATQRPKFSGILNFIAFFLLG